MGRVGLKCAHAELLFHEAEGLLLSAGLVPLDARHRTHLLVFQLSYLGPGELTVQTGLSFGAAADRLEDDESAYADTQLRGADRGPPGVWLASVPVSEDRLDCRLTILGQCDQDSRVRGSLVADLSGYAPLITATTRASVVAQV